MKHVYLSLLFISLAISVKSQNSKPDSADMSMTVKREATKMFEFLVRRDANALINFHPPKAVQGVGGTQKFIEAMEKLWHQEDSQGFRLIADSIGELSKIICYKKVYQCTVYQTMILKYKEKKKISIEYPIIALSYDGEKWYFIDTKGDWDNINNIYRKFPELSSELSFPEEPKIQILDN